MLALGSFWKTCTPWEKHSRVSVLPQVSWDYANSWKHLQSRDRKCSRTKGPSSEKQQDDHDLQSTSHTGHGVCASLLKKVNKSLSLPAYLQEPHSSDTYEPGEPKNHLQPPPDHTKQQ